MNEHDKLELVDLGDAKEETKQFTPGNEPDEMVGIGRNDLG